MRYTFHKTHLLCSIKKEKDNASHNKNKVYVWDMSSRMQGECLLIHLKGIPRRQLSDPLLISNNNHGQHRLMVPTNWNLMKEIINNVIR